MNMDRELAKMFASLGGRGGGLGGMPLSAHPNPDVPLAFERAGSDNQPEDPAWTSEVTTCLAVGGIDASGEGAAWPSLGDENIENLKERGMEAMMLAFEACASVGTHPSKAAAQAHAALQIAPTWCPEAYNVLAQCQASSLEEALEFYQKAEAAGKELVKDADARIAMRTGKMWDDLHLRPYFRAIHGQANTLRKLGRHREALAKYLLLEKYDSNWYTARATYTNYRYHLPAMYLAMNNPEAASRYLARWAEQGYSLNSTSLCWHYTRALLDFKMSPRPRGCEIGEYIRFADDPGKASLLKAVQNAPAVLYYLDGRKPLPGGRLPLACLPASSLVAAVSYVRSYGAFWRETPGALEWAQKNANTFFAMLLFREPSLSQHGSVFVELKRDVATLRRLCFENGGIYPNEPLDFNNGTLLMEAVVTTHIPNLKKAPFVRVLLEAGCDPAMLDTDGLSAAHKACYYDFDPETLKALLKAGYDACVDSPRAKVPSPMNMALNQGNWRSVQTILACLPKDSPYLRQQQLFRWYVELARSGVYDCLARGNKCTRCMQDSNPHAMDKSIFETCVDVLLQYGLDPSFAIDREMNRHPLSRYAKERKKSRGAGLETGKAGASAKAGTQAAPPPAAAAASTVPKKKMCASCGKAAGEAKVCGGCRQVNYCSRECQANHWKQGHKTQCAKGHLHRS